MFSGCIVEFDGDGIGVWVWFYDGSLLLGSLLPGSLLPGFS